MNKYVVDFLDRMNIINYTITNNQVRLGPCHICDLQFTRLQPGSAVRFNTYAIPRGKGHGFFIYSTCQHFFAEEYTNFKRNIHDT